MEDEKWSFQEFFKSHCGGHFYRLFDPSMVDDIRARSAQNRNWPAATLILAQLEDLLLLRVNITYIGTDHNIRNYCYLTAHWVLKSSLLSTTSCVTNHYYVTTNALRERPRRNGWKKWRNKAGNERHKSY